MSHRYPFSVINPTDYYGHRVAVYYNLHYHVFSVKQDGRNGLLLTHAAMCELSDATFEVQQKGRARAIAQGRKNVHAYVVGTLRTVSWDVVDEGAMGRLVRDGYKRVTYDLYPEHSQFYFKDIAEYTPVLSADLVILAGKVGLVWVG